MLMQSIVRTFIIFFFWIIKGSNAYSFQDSYEHLFKVDVLTKEESVGSYLEYYEDITNSLTIEEILNNKSSKWTKSDKEVPNFGFTGSTYWVKLTIEYSPDIVNENKSYLLEFNAPTYKIFEHYYRDANSDYYQKKSYGLQFPFQQRDVNYRNFVINLNPRSKISTHYFKVESIFGLAFPLTIYTANQFQRKNAIENILFGIYTGILFIMIFYNLIIYSTIRDKSYLYYIFYVSTFLLTVLSLKGLSFQYLWPDRNELVEFLIISFILITSIFILQFSRLFLNLKNIVSSADKIATWVIRLILVVVILNIIGRNHYLANITSIIALFVGVFVLSCGIIGVLKNYRPARYFMLAWSVFLISIIIYTLKTHGIITTNVITNNGILIGSAFEVALISFALAYKIRLLSIEKDTAQRKLIVALQESEEKDSMIGVASHDLKSPLNQIKGLMDLVLLSKLKLDKGNIQYLNMIYSTTERLILMVRRLLDVDAIEGKRVELNLQCVNLVEPLKSVAANFKSVANKKKIKIHVNIGKASYYAYVDLDFLIQVYENLLSNAIKFSGFGKNVYLELSTNDGQVITEIRDQGQGIRPDEMNKLYKKFQKLKAQPTAKEASSGLGLFIVKKYTEAMGGTVRCESSVGKGTSFFVNFDIQNLNDNT